MEWLTHSQTGFQQAARYLLGMRLAIVVFQLAAVAIAVTIMPLAHRSEALLISLLYAGLALLGWLWFARRPPRTTLLVSAGLALDLLLIGGWLFYTGGYTNPLVSLLLLPISIAIILVPLRDSIALTITGVGIYTTLVLWHSPVAPDHHGSHLAQFHLIGMWVSFVITALILLLIVGALAQRLRQKQVQLAEFRENRLRDEQIIALGLSSASVAHRLGTPLNTLKLLVEDMIVNHRSGDLAADLQLMEEQVELCGDQLHQLSTTAMQVRNRQLEVLSLNGWMKRLKESTTLLWPAAPIQWQAPFPDSPIAVDATLDQAILNLLANAIEASPEWVAVSAQITCDGRIEITVEDHGDGLDVSLQENAGSDPVHSERGLGVGLFLSNATIQRLGGNLKARTDDEGTTMVIDLPVATDDQICVGDTP